MSKTAYERPQAHDLVSRLMQPRRHIQVVAGPRQVGKTTLVTQVLGHLAVPSHYASADEPTLRGAPWLQQQWDMARLLADKAGPAGAILALDEIQKVSAWSEAIKRLWDEDTRAERALHVVLLGSAPLLVQRGLTESLMGRFELLHLPHWTYAEMRDAFGWTLDQHVVFGAYPGSVSLIGDPQRWARYVRDALIEPTIARDVLLLSRVDKPALLRRLFELACLYSGQVLSYTKMLGQLQEAGNTTTLAHYLHLLEGAGMVMGLQKYAGDAARRRGSSPKLLVQNTALFTAQSDHLQDLLDPTRRDPSAWGRLVESAVGAHLANAAAQGRCELFYWRERNREVDFVTRVGAYVTAIEVKSTAAPTTLPGMDAFHRAFHPDRALLVGGSGIDLETFLSHPATHWITA
ncbi:MAG: ATP-binding protein [Deltaproteobacteria bacterium]|nr:ATP-binding protein [Deltaproteobacteria bacterium]